MNVRPRLSRLESGDAARFLLCPRLDDIRWLTGFTGSTATLLVDRNDGVGHLFVDSRYLERAHHEVSASDAQVEIHLVESGTSIAGLIGDVVQKNSVVVDPQHVTVAQFTTFQEKMSLNTESSPLDELRRVKDEHEIDLIARAALIADDALASLLQDGLHGRTEREIARQLDYLMRSGGADDVGFDTIVATGANAARPHHEPSDAVVEDGHCVIIDFGAELDGYRSDMTRTIRVGSVSDELQSMFEIVREAQQCGVDAVTSGVVGSQIDAAVRAVFAREGVDHEFIHGTGHGIGLYIHEPPILSPRCEAVLQVNEVVTVEPGLYRYGVGGVRIEDLVVVTDSRCRILTNTPKDLLCPRSPRMI
jgi:Xaa-Pro aminopeptidase